jgi:hypothetical protein
MQPPMAKTCMDTSNLSSSSMLFPNLLVVLLFWSVSLYCQERVQDITCDNGGGEYRDRFSTGVTVSVGAIRNGAFAERACDAKLTWNAQELPVATDATQIGIDVLGADLGLNVPVIAFQIGISGVDSQRTYQIYSLRKPPRMLHMISGGDIYSAADTDLDGRVEIWTDDAKGVANFERVPLKDLDLVPTVVLRFERGHLIDVSSQFQSHYDAQIADLRAHLDPADLDEFRNSDGTLSARLTRPTDQGHRLIRAKIKVLEIVWSYLYSGREQEAWSVLAAMWPSSDLDRIRAAISDAHAHGILQSVQGTTRGPSRRPFNFHAEIYDAVVTSEGTANTSYIPIPGVTPGSNTEPTVVQPKSILLRRPPADGQQELSRADEIIELVVDAAGKVRSARIANGSDKQLIDASSGWQFIPAFREGRPVACRFHLKVRSLQ